jgi:hydrogenase nickel incorporation protein HypA/HybF
MHELSIALSLLDLAAEEGERRGGRIVAVHLRLGPLAGVVKEALLSAYELAREGTPCASAALIVQDVPLTAWCPACAAACNPPFPELCCPVCGTPTPDVRSGRELEVVALEIET